MNKTKSLLLLGALVCAFSLWSCCSSDDSASETPSNPGTENGGGAGGNGGGTTITPADPIKPANMQPAALTGFVYDTDGKALSGVKVTSGTQSVITRTDGGFVFSTVNAVDGRTVVRFSKSGYADIVRSAAKLDGDAWEVVMTYKNDYSEKSISKQEYMSADYNRNINVQGMQVELQGGGIVNAATGEVTTGYITTDVVYLSPENEDFSDLMPGGDLAAEQVNKETGQKEEVQLISYGMTSVSMTDNAGNKLQLKPGDDGKARVTFPVPADMSDDKHIGDPIPLWSFDEERGIWVEEGVATYNAEENVYEGYVSHFSWANLDWPEKRATIAVTVVDDDGTPIPNVKVTIGQVSKTTKKDGKAETYVPINTEFKVTVLPEDYVNYTQIQEVTVGESELEAGKTKEITITLPTLAHVSGIITNKGSGNQVATVWIEYNNKSTKKVHSDVNGKFFLSAPATSDYTGKATLKVRTADGVVKSFDIDLNGQDQSFNITIDTDVSSGGSVKAKAKETGEEFTFTISDAKDEDFEGVSIIDNMLTIVANYERKHHSQGAMEEGFDVIELNINNYNEGTTEYSINDKNYFYFNHNGYDDYANINAMSGTIKVTKQGTAYRFQIQGEGRLYADGITTNNNSNEPNVTFQADFTLSYLMNATSKRSVSSADVPANTPLLTGNSQNPLIAAIITNSSKLDKGALIAYGNKDITFDEFKALKTQADEAFGAPLENSYYNEASPNDNSNLYYFKDNNYLELVWWPWSSFTEENAMEMSSISMFMHGGTGRISITSYSGLKIPYKQFTEMMRVKKDRPNIWE